MLFPRDGCTIANRGTCRLGSIGDVAQTAGMTLELGYEIAW